jgi:glycosyltransferase involved in cell wall biosynthesis
MKISAVLIGKNEEVMLARCLESVKGLDEIIFCDTGSSDKTVEIAKKYTDKVYTDFVWCDDFAKARTHAKSKATGDWILSIDCDEVLYDVNDVREAVALAEAKGIKAVDTHQITNEGTGGFYFPRLFKNCPEVFWDPENPIHNALNVMGEKIGNVRIRVDLSPAHKNDPNRAFRILKKAVAEFGTPRQMYYLGREYWYRQDYQNAVLVLTKYILVSQFLSEKADAFLIMAKCLWALKRWDEARSACAEALIINARFKEAILLMAEMSWPHNAVQWRKMAETANNEGVLFIR